MEKNNSPTFHSFQLCSHFLTFPLGILILLSVSSWRGFLFFFCHFLPLQCYTQVVFLPVIQTFCTRYTSCWTATSTHHSSPLYFSLFHKELDCCVEGIKQWSRKECLIGMFHPTAETQSLHFSSLILKSFMETSCVWIGSYFPLMWVRISH